MSELTDISSWLLTWASAEGRPGQGARPCSALSAAAGPSLGPGLRLHACPPSGISLRLGRHAAPVGVGLCGRLWDLFPWAWRHRPCLPGSGLGCSHARGGLGPLTRSLEHALAEARPQRAMGWGPSCSCVVATGADYLHHDLVEGSLRPLHPDLSLTCLPGRTMVRCVRGKSRLWEDPGPWPCSAGGWWGRVQVSRGRRSSEANLTRFPATGPTSAAGVCPRLTGGFRGRSSSAPEGVGGAGLGRGSG